MAALRTIHLCPYNFSTTDPVVIGTEIDGGTSVAGIQDTIATDGGGYWQWTLNSGSFGGRSDDRRNQSLSWRAINAGLSGGNRAVFRFCDRYHQPVLAARTVPHSDGTPFDDDTLYASPGADAHVLAVNNGQTGGLNCTSLDIAITSERALIGGERFTYVHPTWLERCAETYSVEPIDGGVRIKFQPPIRGGINVGDPLDFDDPRCVMRRISAPTNALSPGSLTTQVSSLVLVEDMRDPDL
jgi:hypothetical protein